MWQSLAEILQQDDANRQKILYYKTIATDWMTDASVDILAQASPDVPWHPTRCNKRCSTSCGGTPSKYILGRNGVLVIKSRCKGDQIRKRCESLCM